jgi:hypothetical protein
MKKTFFNRVMLIPDERNEKFQGITIGAQDKKILGTVVAVADNITDIKLGDRIWYIADAQEIDIKGERTHIVTYPLQTLYFDSEEQNKNK